MAKILPKEVMLEIRSAIYRKADDADYMHKTRIESGAFMDSLVKADDVGVILSNYMKKEKIRTYIKDGVLRVYTKAKRKYALPSNLEDLLPIVKLIYRQSAHKIDAENDLFLLRLDDNDLLLVAFGTLLKWESALRKALEYIAKAPGLPSETEKIQILLVIAVLNCPTTQADRNHLISALDYIGVKLSFVEDGK